MPTKVIENQYFPLLIMRYSSDVNFIKEHCIPLAGKNCKGKKPFFLLLITVFYFSNNGNDGVFIPTLSYYIAYVYCLSDSAN